ncbi:MAG TPA: tyrosine-type recombinase/integrase [Gemmatimonadales bacterium]|nr:tyrosine-type recombinase/integrase [Gemmatimonadales bacterium]
MSQRLQKTKTPGVYRRGSRYVVTYRDQHGTPRKRSARTLAQARDLKAELTADLRRGDYRHETRLSFADYMQEWMQTFNGRTSAGIRPETLKDYHADLRRDALPYFGRMQLAAITPRDIKNFAALLTQRGLKPSSVRNILAPLRALLATAYEDGLIRSNPCTGLRISQRVPGDQDQRQSKALTEDELHAFLAGLPAEWRLFFEFLTHTGLRVGEAVALTWKDLDTTTHRIHVRRRLYRGRFDTPKSRYSTRSVPLSPRLLERILATRNDAADTAPLFPSKIGTHLDQSKVFNRVLKPTARKAGVPWAGFHTFRHTCATLLFKHGLNAKQIQTWLGHHSPAFTLATYVHLIPDDLPTPAFFDAVTSGEPAALSACASSATRATPKTAFPS